MRTLVLLFTMMAFVFAGLFVADLRGFFNATANPVAFLKTSAGTVKRLAKDQLTWDRAQGGSLFGSGDTISTGEDSGAKLIFYAGGELELEAGAMVVLAGSLEELKLNFVTGSGKIRVAKKAQGKLTVTRGNKVATTKPAPAKTGAARTVASATKPGAPVGASGAGAAAPDATASNTTIAAADATTAAIAAADATAADAAAVGDAGTPAPGAAANPITIAEAGSPAPGANPSAASAVASAGTPAPGATTVAAKTSATPSDTSATARVAANSAAAPGAPGAATTATIAANSPAAPGAPAAAPAAEEAAAQSDMGIEVAVVDDIVVPPPPPATNLNDTAKAVQPTEAPAKTAAAPGKKTASRATASTANSAAGNTADATSGDSAANGSAPEDKIATAETAGSGVAGPVANTPMEENDRKPAGANAFAGPAIQEKNLRHPEKTLSAGTSGGLGGAGTGELITVAKLPPTPEIKYPANDAVIDLANGQVPRLQWNLPKELAETPDKVSYEITLRPAEGNGAEKVIRSEHPELSLSQISRGKYLWSVRAIDGKGKRGPSSEPRWLEVKVPAQIARPVVLPVRIIEE